MSQQTFANFIGINAASLSSIFNDRTRPTLNTVEAIKSKIPNLNTDWLMFGHGQMFNDAKGDGDADWVQITTSTADPAGWSEVTANVNRTNCQLKFTNITDAHNAYMFRLTLFPQCLSQFPYQITIET